MHDSKAVKIHVAKLGAWQTVKKKNNWLMTAGLFKTKAYLNIYFFPAY